MRVRIGVRVRVRIGVRFRVRVGVRARYRVRVTSPSESTHSSVHRCSPSHLGDVGEIYGRYAGDVGEI